MKFKKLLSYEWDAIAGLLAAVAAIILHLLHIVDEHVILPIVLSLQGLLFINFMRHTRNNELTAEQVEQTVHAVSRIESTLKPADIILIGPRQLRSVSEQFARHMSGDAIWFNVCLSMYRPQPLFDALLRPAIENSTITSNDHLDSVCLGCKSEKFMAGGSKAKNRHMYRSYQGQRTPLVYPWQEYFIYSRR
jgi:hypothetical protein